MPDPRKFPRLLAVACGLTTVFGLFMESNEWKSMSVGECGTWALIGLVFFVAVSVLAAALEKGLMALGTAFRRVADRRSPGLKSKTFRRWGFCECGGWLATSLGVGIAASALWAGGFRFWQGLPFIGGGLGLIVGCRLAIRIMGTSQSDA